MAKKLKLLEGESKKLFDALRNTKERKEAAQAEILTLESRKAELDEKLRKAVMLLNSQAEVERIEAEQGDADRLIKRHGFLVEGLESEVASLQMQIKQAEDAKTALFVEAARPVLQSLKEEYDSQAVELQNTVKKLMAAHQWLRSRNAGPIFFTMIGEGARALPTIKLPLMGDFSPGRMMNAAHDIHPGAGTLKELELAIMKNV